MRWNERKRNGKEKQKQKQQSASWQYICQYKIQYIIPNISTNKESIAHKDSIHNQLKTFNHYPLIVWGGGVINHFWTLPERRKVSCQNMLIACKSRQHACQFVVFLAGMIWMQKSGEYLSNSAHHFAPISPWPSNRDHDAKDPMLLLSILLVRIVDAWDP